MKKMNENNGKSMNEWMIDRQTDIEIKFTDRQKGRWIKGQDRERHTKKISAIGARNVQGAGVMLFVCTNGDSHGSRFDLIFFH